MEYTVITPTQYQEVIRLYTEVFSNSEGEAQGKVIEQLVTNLITTTQIQDLFGYVAAKHNKIVGCIFFSRLTVPSNQQAFILSPVAVASNEQGNGIGQHLINFGLNELKKQAVDLVFTYGDPAYYAKVGFEKMNENTVKAPFPLSQPIGWLAQSLNGATIPTMHGATKCVEAFNDPSYW